MTKPVSFCLSSAARVGSQTELTTLPCVTLSPELHECALTTILTTAPTTHHELLRHLKRLKARKFPDRRHVATCDKIVEWFSTPPISTKLIVQSRSRSVAES